MKFFQMNFKSLVLWVEIFNDGSLEGRQLHQRDGAREEIGHEVATMMRFVSRNWRMFR